MEGGVFDDISDIGNDTGVPNSCRLFVGRKQTARFMSLNGALPPICRLARMRGGQYRQIISRGGPMSHSASDDIA